MIWYRMDYRRTIINEYGGDQAFLMLYHEDLMDYMLPTPGLIGFSHDLANGLSNFRFSINKSRVNNTSNFKNTLNLTITGSNIKNLSNNPWIRFLQQNKGKFKGSDWLNQARNAYRSL